MRYFMPSAIAVTNAWILRVMGRNGLTSRENHGSQKFYVVERTQAATPRVRSPRQVAPKTAHLFLL